MSTTLSNQTIFVRLGDSSDESFFVQQMMDTATIRHALSDMIDIECLRCASNGRR